MDVKTYAKSLLGRDRDAGESQQNYIILLIESTKNKFDRVDATVLLYRALRSYYKDNDTLKLYQHRWNYTDFAGWYNALKICLENGHFKL